MKSYYVIGILVSLFYSSSLLPQGTSEELIHNSQSLNFYIVNGYAFSYKFKNESTTKFRLHVDLSSSYSDGDDDSKRDEKYMDQVTHYDENGHAKRREFYITVSPEFYFDVQKTSYANLYLGAGPFLGYSHSRQSSGSVVVNSQPGNENSHENINVSNSYSLGAEVFAGIEGYITKNISLFSELRLNGGRNWNKDEYTYTSTYTSSSTGTISKTDQNSWFYNLSNIRIGLSVYF